MFGEHGILDLSNSCENPKSVYLKSEATGRPVELKIGCGCRYDIMCPHCAETWRKKNRAKYKKVVQGFADIKFLTLTLAKTDKDADYVENIKNLWQYRKDLFRALREGVTWTDKRGIEHREKFFIGGWVAAIELPNHIHILMDSDYIPQKLIKAKWREITGDSFIVDIRQDDNIRNKVGLAVWYITKYLTKLTKISYTTGLFLKGFHLVGMSRGPRTDHETTERKDDPNREKFMKIDKLEFMAIWGDWYPIIRAQEPDRGPLDRWLKDIGRPRPI